MILSGTASAKRFVEGALKGDVAAVVAAAGEGTRAALGRNKALAPVAGRPMAAWAVEGVRAHPRVGEVVLVLRPEDVAAWPATAGVRVATGGPTRAASVLAGLEALGGPGDRIVLVHDGARPLVRGEDVERVLSALEDAEGAAIGVRVEEALKRVRSDGIIEASLDRRAHWLARTPQTFPLDLLRRALQSHPEAEDCASAVAAIGGRVRIVEGRRDNVKVTWPGDVGLAEHLLGLARAFGGHREP